MRGWRLGAAVLAAATFLGILTSRLIFAPVPWPDGSAFYLPGLDLIHWPPHWIMHNQAAFVPSYDEANFNIMPALPFILGLAANSGLLQIMNPELMIRGLSLIVLVAWAWLLWEWLIEAYSPLAPPKQARIMASVVAAAALWDPVLRWGTLVVRTEIWIGLCLVWLLREMDRWEHAELLPDAATRWPRSANRIAAGLAFAAYIHYESIYFVPAVIVGLGFQRGWFKRLVGVGLRTTLLLTPWLIFVALHFSLFVDQMQIQFFRLSHGNHWMANPYMIFHSMFVDHGSPAGWPKFFNVGKGVFWVLVLGLSALTLRTRLKHTRVLAASAVAFIFSFYLWATKAEVWFVTLCHVAFWPWVGAALIELKIKSPWHRATQGLAAASAVLSLTAAFAQARAISPSYTWPVYEDWIDCLERTVGPLADKPGLKVWQPHVPDTLVEFSHRHPNWDMTRSLDFTARMDLAFKAAHQMDVILFTRFFNLKRGEAVPNYTGPLRDDDRTKMSNGIDLPFGPWGLDILPKEEPGKWQTTVCEIGPFWAAALVRKPN